MALTAWLSASEVAAVLDCAPKTVKRIPARWLPYMRLTERGDRRYRRADLDTYIEGRMVR